MIRNRRSSLTLFQELGYKLPEHNGGVVGAGEVKRLVPSGPNPETSPESPDRFAPVAPGPITRMFGSDATSSP